MPCEASNTLMPIIETQPVAFRGKPWSQGRRITSAQYLAQYPDEMAKTRRGSVKAFLCVPRKICWRVLRYVDVGQRGQGGSQSGASPLCARSGVAGVQARRRRQSAQCWSS